MARAGGSDLWTLADSGSLDVRMQRRGRVPIARCTAAAGAIIVCASLLAFFSDGEAWAPVHAIAAAANGFEREVVVCAGFLVAGFVQGVLGFGAGIVAMAILPVVLQLMDAVPIVAASGFAQNALILLHLRSSVDRRIFSVIPWLLVGQFLGAPLGVRLLQFADARLLHLILGSAMVGFSAHHVCERRRQGEVVETKRGGLEAADAEAVDFLKSDASSKLAVNELSYRISPRWGLPFGLVSGVLNGALNEGGPPVVIYFALQRWEKDRVKAALQVVSIFSSCYGIAILCSRGVLQKRHLYYDMIGFPAAALGILLGFVFSRRLDARLFADVVAAVLLAAGLAYTVSSASALLPQSTTR